MQDAQDPICINSFKWFGEICKKSGRWDFSFKRLLDLEHCALWFPESIKQCLRRVKTVPSRTKEYGSCCAVL